jgi:hypothetical protein
VLPDFRRFADATRAIDKRWSTCACSGDAWVPTGIGWGHTNNRPVQVATPSGLIGVQKPGLVSPTNPNTAATEKIVADLAHHLGLPVPPVTLWDRGASASPPRFVAVSAWAYTNALTWGQADPGMSPQQRTELVPWASAMVPFESWISAGDRQNPGNMLVGISPGGEVLGAWIDYAFALDFVWKGNHMTQCDVPPLYPAVGLPLRDVMIEVADGIVGMDNAIIEGIVNRVPSEYLPRAVADNIIRNLLSRRASVRALL